MQVRHPFLYARWLIAVGGFHEHAHFMFLVTEGFWHCLLYTLFIRVLLFENIREVTNNLEHNAYAHHQNAHHAVVLGIVAYILQDVQYPPPKLFLQSLELYSAQVNHATGIVLLMYLRYGGFPIVQWQRSAREGDGMKLKKLFAYSFHACRSLGHKPVCVQILLIGLLGFCCALPALQKVLLATTSLSLLGRLGANIYVDRLLEYINKIQQGTKRSSNAASFAHALDLTTLLGVILHVRHAFQNAELGQSESDSTVTPSMLRQARVVQDYLVTTIGRDLTVFNFNNMAWHTGNAVPVDGGDYRTRTPWLYFARVQTGRSAGKGRARAESWSAYTLRFVYDHFFPF
jgi:hypothetical protein